jgi:hypothetical protein
MFESDPDFKQGIERARIFYDNGMQDCIDVWIAATMALFAQYPPEIEAEARATLHAAIDRFPTTQMGKRP